MHFALDSNLLFAVSICLLYTINIPFFDNSNDDDVSDYEILELISFAQLNL